MWRVDVRRAFFSRGMRLVNHPKVARVLGDPRALDAFVALARVKERVTMLVDRARRLVTRTAK